MDPLSVTAGVIAVATLAWQSCKAAHCLVNALAAAPEAITRSKNSLIETQKTLGALQQTLTTTSENVLDPILRTIQLDATLTSTQRLCDEYTAAITRYTSHSTEERFSKRDRITAYFHESKIKILHRDLGDCQRTLSMVLVSINLILSTRTADDIRQLGDHFQAQEHLLTNLDMQLHNRQQSTTSEEDSAADRDASLSLTAVLQKVCQEALGATNAKRTGQKFGDMSTHDQSQAMQGIVGEVHDGVEQSFGSMTTTNNSRAFQGQMDAASFAVIFGKG